MYFYNFNRIFLKTGDEHELGGVNRVSNTQDLVKLVLNFEKHSFKKGQVK